MKGDVRLVLIKNEIPILEYDTESQAMVLYRKEEGYSVVEMEYASLAACARKRGVSFGQLLFTADSLANINEHDIRNGGNDTFEVALILAMDAVSEV